MQKGTRVKDAMTGKAGTVEADLGIIVIVIMDDGETRRYAPSQLRVVS